MYCNDGLAMKRITTRSATLTSNAIDQSIANVIANEDNNSDVDSDDCPLELFRVEGVIDRECYEDEPLPASLLSTLDIDDGSAARVRDYGPIPDLSTADQNDGWIVDNGLPATWDPSTTKPVRGPSWPMNNYTPLDFFQEVFTAVIENFIVHETNNFITASDSNVELTCAAELRKLIGIFIWSGVEKKPAYTDHWKCTDDNPVASCMTLNRFKFLLSAIYSAIHFANNAKLPPQGVPGHDPYGKARSILQLFVERWDLLYKTGVFVSGDESLNGFMGRVYFLQYIKSKHTRWGVKHYICSCAVSGYVKNLIPYTGSEPVEKNSLWASFNPSERWALRLSEGLMPGQIVLFDNWFTSYKLFDHLAAIKIGAVGTVRRNRKDLPSTLKTMPKLRKPIHYRNKDVLLSVFSDKDKLISLLSTTSEARDCTIAQRDRNEEMKIKFVQKPESSKVYNRLMIGVDLMDQKAQPYRVFPHRTTRWFHREFYRFLEITLVNDYILYRSYAHNTMSPKQFRKQIALALMGEV